MTQSLFSTLIADLLGDLRNPALLWQVVALIACFGCGAVAARVLRERFISEAGHGGHRSFIRMGVESFGRVMSPLLALALIAVTRLVLERFQSVTLLRIAIPLVGSFALIRLVFYILRRAFARAGRGSLALLLSETIVASVVWIGVALYITGLWPGLVDYLDKTVVPLGRHPVSVLAILQAALSVMVTLMLALWIGALLEERLMRMESVHSSLRVVMTRMVRALLILVALLLSLSLVGIDITVLSVFGGALGVGIGLGMQKIVSNYVSGFVILIERSLKIGDIVLVDKYLGTVAAINTRYTIIRGADGVETVVPNEMLISGAVQNYSLTDSRLRLATQITVAYQSDIETLLRLLQETVAGVDRVLQQPAPQAFLLRFGADGLELEVGFWINDPENGRGNALSDVNRAIWRTLQKHQVEVPYPQREIRLVDARATICKISDAAGVPEGQ